MEEKRYWTNEEIDEYLMKLNEYNEKSEVKIDMHNHTTGSDGNDSPLMLLLRAHRLGLKTISITDHNTIGGYRRLQEQINEKIERYEEIVANTNTSEEEKQKARICAKRLLKILNEVDIVTGCEVLTIFKGCPYVEILAYDVDLGMLEQKLSEARDGLEQPGEVLAKGLKEAAKKHNMKIDEFFIDNRSDYRKLFFHEMIRHPENIKFYESIEGETEKEKAQNFARQYIDNPESDFYVDLNNASTRKKAMIKMIKEHDDLVFDTAIIQSAGGAAGQFYIELMKHPENKALIDPRITTNKTFNYLGLYNESSSFYVDLSTTKPSPQSVINAIHEAGGKAMVAHWGRYKLSNPDVFDWTTPEGKANLEEIIDMCDGAECSYPDNPMDLRRMIYNMCKEKGKLISIGGDNHGKSGKEGPQYQLGSQSGKEVEELKWVKKSVIEGHEFIKMLEEEHKYKRRLQEIIGEKVVIEKIALDQSKEEKGKMNDQDYRDNKKFF